MSRYQDAGVDVNAGYELVARIKEEVASTKQPGVLGGLGSFGGLFDLGELAIKHPILVSGTDGVGTKLLVAQKANLHDTIGIDCVAMCVNDIIAQGAKPLYFLDYIATGHNDPKKMAEIVKGVASGCRQAEVALIGGETAEMPDMYSSEEYDLAGFSTGVVEKKDLLTDEKPQVGDILLGLPSSGLHSNGFSLVRQILFKENGLNLNDKPIIFEGKTLGDVLLEPTKIYVKNVLPLLESRIINGISHITGGGLIENLPRMFADNIQAKVNKGSWPVLPIFNYLKELGNLTDRDCFEAFNMGLGMVIAISPDKLEKAKAILVSQNEEFYIIGELVNRLADSEKISIK